MMGVEEGNRNGEDAGITSNGASQLLSLFNTPDHPSPDTSQEQKEDHHAVNSSLNLLEAGIQKKKEGIYVFPEKPVIRHERQRTFVTSNQSKLELIASNDHFNHIQKESANVLRNQTSQSYSESHPSYIHDAKNTFDKTPSTLETESLLRNEQKQSSENQYSATTLNDLFTPPKPSYDRLTSYSLPTKNSLAYGNEKLKEENTNVQNSEKSCFFSLLSPEEIVPTLMASVVFLLYHLVFALALASAISASISSDTFASPLLCPLAKMAVLSSIFGGPGLAFIFRKELPSLYPCLDLFLVPFLTQLAQIVDETIRNNYSNSPDALSGDLFPPNPMQYSNLFLNTFAVLSGLGMFLSGILCILGSKIKLANLGGFLPNAVLCGFFSSVGITLWTSAFSVDTGGLSVQDITSSNLFNALLHHLPSLCVGILIFWIGSKYMIPFVLLSIMIVYCIMAVTQTSLEAAQELGWFWTQKDFNYDYSYGGQIVGFTRWSPPFPLGVIHSIWALNFDAQAVQNGIPTVFAMAFIYAIRCSLHAPALIKNKPKILSIIEETDKLSVVDNSSKENVLIREVSVDSTSSTQYDQDIQKYKRHKVDVLKVLRWYGNMHILSGVIGGFACMPSIGAAPTITKLGKGAEKTAPQYGSVALLLLFYLTNFKPVSYIPKIAFSSLLVLSFLDLMNAWFLQSYKLTKDKYEWLVVPAIILFSFLVGMLASVALGVAISTFIFVGSFYKTGVVKFIDTGLLVRSTVERNAEDAAWLDQNGDLIQIMVLQNYLFFGNSSSCLKYISSMFEDVPIPDDSDFDLPPIPKYLVIDFSICSGMDTSAVSVFGEVIDLCEQNNCKAIFAGMSRNLKEMMKFGGVIESKKKKHVFISTNLESALGNAEDSLLSRFAQFRKIEYIKHHKQNTSPSHGFFSALREIDDQHGTKFQTSLRGLQSFTVVVELSKNEKLFKNETGDGIISESERGIFFIEYGLIRVERDPSFTLSRSVNSMNKITQCAISTNQWNSNDGSIGQFKARTPTIGKKTSYLKSHKRAERNSHTFRLARIGPGWVIGGLESCAGLRNPGIYTAVSDCRLHHLSNSVVDRIERDDPALILNLFKMLSHLMARRQDVTIEQLATLHAIISSSPVKKPISRVTKGALEKAAIMTMR